MKKLKGATSRRQSRCFAMQALYQWQVNPVPLEELIRHLQEEDDFSRCDIDYFKELLMGSVNHIAQIDEAMSPCLDRSIDELNPVELAALRVAIFELMHRLDVPYRVVINEALEIVKQFGSDQGHKYVNAVLDKLAPKLREAEIASKKN
ncbi:MAG: transcription antitermination factor NusB [Gammaproteobacteria bacterium]|nr:transcription antitermination factor NusB [Gammaproteobacteria bacterium]MCH9744469.1 transcription antitermination factor NusB [Gammaproteobacteria bacterium]